MSTAIIHVKNLTELFSNRKKNGVKQQKIFMLSIARNWPLSMQKN